MTQNSKEVKILANHLKIKNELDGGGFLSGGYIDKKKISLYQANDMISFNNNKN